MSAASLLRALALTVVAFAAPAVAYDPAQPPYAALATLRNIDCQVDAAECRYFAALEVAAYFDACQAMWDKRYKANSTPEETAELNSWLTNWTQLDTPALKQAVLNPENPVRKLLAESATEYLMKATSTDASLECARLGEVKQNHEPEPISDLLRTTKNYPEWAAKVRAKRQAEFDAAQARLRSGRAPDFAPPPMPTQPPAGS